MFHQLLQPVGGSLFWSFLVASIPVFVVLILLGVVRLPAWQAALAGLVSALIVATTIWRMPVDLALTSVAAGATFALWPVMWIVFNGLILYNVTVVSGRFDAFRLWMLQNLPNDRRVVLVIVGFCFGCLLEGVAGYGLPVAITSSLLIALGFPPVQALVVTLIFNTAPVAFGGLGVPVTTLAAVTQLPADALGAMIGRQLPFVAILLPFYAIASQESMRSLRGVWPALLVAGVSFAIGQFVASNYLGYELTDLVSALTDRHDQLPQVLEDQDRRALCTSTTCPSHRPERTRQLERLGAVADHGGHRDRMGSSSGEPDRRVEGAVAFSAQRDLHHRIQQAV
jgi:lactate permease